MANIMIIDTETVGDISDKTTLRVYDIGYQIVDTKDYSVIFENQFLISDYICDVQLMNTAYYVNKLPEYRKLYKKNPNILVTFNNAWQTIKNNILEFNIKKVYAFNASFDRAALNATITAQSNGYRKTFLPFGVKWFCIWSYAVSVLVRPSYFKFAENYSLFTAKGNLQTNAECLYKYIIQDSEYIEPHISLGDVDIERQILAKCAKQHKRYDASIQYNLWRKANQKYVSWLER